MMAEHSLVVLDADPSHEKLSRGDVGTVVHIYKGGKGYEVEFVDGGGRTVALVRVGADDVRPIKAGELLHTRTTVWQRTRLCTGEIDSSGNSSFSGSLT